jgi:DNA-binding transcriptional ArsR family regulator
MHINWQQFGLKSNPYDTAPLVDGGGLPLKDAFIGRDNERKILDDLFELEDNICLTLCGDPGVGKTSLANFQKFMWKHNEKNAFFSCRREIEASDTLLDKRNFLLEIIGSILREIKLTESNLSNPLLSKLNAIVDFTQKVAISGGVSVDVNGFGGGVSFAKDRNNSLPVQLTMASVEQHFVDLLNFIKTEEIGGRKYKGLIVHVNNFDVVLKNEGNVKKVIAFFDEVRDILQVKDVYFLFLGPANFYSQIIAIEQRVKSIFVRTPLLVKPLNKKNVALALDKRMELLKSDDVQQYIKVIPDEVVFKLYDLYDGDIRLIMMGIKDILGQCSERLLQPLSMNEAMTLLGRERWERISSSLTKEEQKVLEFFVKQREYISAKEIANLLKKQASNMSGYLKALKNLNIIEEKEREGKKVYLGLTNEYQPLKWWFESENGLRKDLGVASISQASLFDE